MTARDVVVSVLADLPALRGCKVLPYARDMDAPTADTVAVRVDEVTPAGPTGTRSYGFALLLVTPFTDPAGPADDDLDGLLEDVLAALDTTSQLAWLRAVRGTFDDRFPCYQVDVSVIVAVPVLSAAS